MGTEQFTEYLTDNETTGCSGHVEPVVMCDEDTCINFDLDRMKKAVNSPTIRLPDDIKTAEQFRSWIMDFQLYT